MKRISDRTNEVRGARDLADLWRLMPIGILRYGMPEPVRGLDPLSVSDFLRPRAWREHCARPDCPSCADLEHSCALAGDGSCRADMLFPMYIGGGAPSWRMARFLPRWMPQMAELQIVALGEPACNELGWAARTLSEQFGLRPIVPAELKCFSDIELRESGFWRMQLTTPWLLGKNQTPALPTPTADDVTGEIAKSLKVRAHKFTALCSADLIWQSLGGHLVHHVADALLPGTLSVLSCTVRSLQRDSSSRSNGGKFVEIAWEGAASIRADETVLPWLTVLALCGGGENADKGFGGVELTPLASI